MKAHKGRLLLGGKEGHGEAAPVEGAPIVVKVKTTEPKKVKEAGEAVVYRTTKTIEKQAKPAKQAKAGKEGKAPKDHSAKAAAAGEAAVTKATEKVAKAKALKVPGFKALESKGRRLQGGEDKTPPTSVYVVDKKVIKNAPIVEKEGPASKTAAYKQKADELNVINKANQAALNVTKADYIARAKAQGKALNATVDEFKGTAKYAKNVAKAEAIKAETPYKVAAKTHAVTYVTDEGKHSKAGRRLAGAKEGDQSEVAAAEYKAKAEAEGQDVKIKHVNELSVTPAKRVRSESSKAKEAAVKASIVKASFKFTEMEEKNKFKAAQIDNLNAAKRAANPAIEAKEKQKAAVHKAEMDTWNAKNKPKWEALAAQEKVSLKYANATGKNGDLTKIG